MTAPPPAAIAELVERLRYEAWNRSETHEICDEAADTLEALSAEARLYPAALQLATENERLRLALKPFARIGEALDFAFAPAIFPDCTRLNFRESWRDNGEDIAVTAGHFRKARAALSPAAPKPIGEREEVSIAVNSTGS